MHHSGNRPGSGFARSFPMLAASTALTLAFAPAAASAEEPKRSTTLAAPETSGEKVAKPDRATMSRYKKASWLKQARKGAAATDLKGGTESREIPPTDCPPAPAQECLDTWDDEMTATPSN